MNSFHLNESYSLLHFRLSNKSSNLFHRTISCKLKLKIPTGYAYFQKEKQLIFNMINFIESEKNGWKIPLYNANGRLKAMVGISMHSVERPKRELWTDQERLAAEIKRENEEELKKQKEQHELTLHLRHRSSSRSENRFIPMGARIREAIPVVREPWRTAHSERLPILLYERQQKHIR